MKRSKRVLRRHIKRKSVVPCQNGWTTANPWLEQVVNYSTSCRNWFALNTCISDVNNIKKMRTSLNTRGIYSSVPTVTIRREPFHIASIENFISDESALQYLYKDMQNLKWNCKKMDLYELSQSPDLSTLSSKYLQYFFIFLKTDVLKWMTDVTGLHFSKVSATCSMYNSTNYLLPHDDLLEDRLIAFIFYICPWRLPSSEFHKKVIDSGWSSKMGGNLQLFAVNKYKEPVYPAVDKISPKNNQFIFFKVCPESYHAVEEIYTDDYSRLSINGWFHGPKFKISEDNRIEKTAIPVTYSYEIMNENFVLDNCVKNSYLNEDSKNAINSQMETNSEIALAEFFNKEFYDEMLGLITSVMKWKRMGPVNKRNYETCFVKKLYDLFYSDAFISLLKSYTDLDLPIGNNNLKDNSIKLEIQRWTSGCYTVISDKSEYDCDELDVIMYFNSTENSQIGTITYLDPIDTEDNVLLTIYPKNNNLNIVYRTSGTTKFTKYVNHKMVEPSKYFYIVSCRYKEAKNV